MTFEPWGLQQIVGEGLVLAAQVGDCLQTFRIAAAKREANPLLGPSPSRPKVVGYFLAASAAHLGVAWLLPSGWREAWIVAFIIGSYFNLGRNWGLGWRLL